MGAVSPSYMVVVVDAIDECHNEENLVMEVITFIANVQKNTLLPPVFLSRVDLDPISGPSLVNTTPIPLLYKILMRKMTFTYFCATASMKYPKGAEQFCETLHRPGLQTQTSKLSCIGSLVYLFLRGHSNSIH